MGRSRIMASRDTGAARYNEMGYPNEAKSLPHQRSNVSNAYRPGTSLHLINPPTNKRTARIDSEGTSSSGVPPESRLSRWDRTCAAAPTPTPSKAATRASDSEEGGENERGSETELECADVLEEVGVVGLEVRHRLEEPLGRDHRPGSECEKHETTDRRRDSPEAGESPLAAAGCHDDTLSDATRLSLPAGEFILHKIQKFHI